MRWCEELGLCRFCDRMCKKRVGFVADRKAVRVPDKINDEVYIKYKDSDGTDFEFRGKTSDLEKILADDKDDE